MVRKTGAVVLAAALMSAQTAFADDATPSVQPLAPGQAAGLHEAQDGPSLNLVAIGAGIVLGATAIYLIAGTHYHLHPQGGSGGGKK